MFNLVAASVKAVLMLHKVFYHNVIKFNQVTWCLDDHVPCAECGYKPTAKEPTIPGNLRFLHLPVNSTTSLLKLIPQLHQSQMLLQQSYLHQILPGQEREAYVLHQVSQVFLTDIFVVVDPSYDCFKNLNDNTDTLFMLGTKTLSARKSLCLFV